MNNMCFNLYTSLISILTQYPTHKNTEYVDDNEGLWYLSFLTGVGLYLTNISYQILFYVGRDCVRTFQI